MTRTEAKEICKELLANGFDCAWLRKEMLKHDQSQWLKESRGSYVYSTSHKTGSSQIRTLNRSADCFVDNLVELFDVDVPVFPEASWCCKWPKTRQASTNELEGVANFKKLVKSIANS